MVYPKLVCVAHVIDWKLYSCLIDCFFAYVTDSCFYLYVKGENKGQDKRNARNVDLQNLDPSTKGVHDERKLYAMWHAIHIPFRFHTLIPVLVDTLNMSVVISGQ